MTTYSAFFSSGLLAPHHASYAGYGHLNTDSYTDYDGPSPATSSSPLPDSDIESERDRDITPTPDASSPSTFSSGSHTTSTTIQPQPRLRRRRSSLKVGTSPMNSIRSPTRNAGAALQLQMHLPNPARSRSGSLSTTAQTDLYGNIGMGNVASEGTSLVGRMRSGSVGAVLRPRRGVRRLASVPAPAPPPTAPLPAIPALLLSPAAQGWLGPHSAPLNGSFHQTCVPFITSNTVMNNAEMRPPLVTRLSSESVTRATQPARGRERSFSLSNGLTIDEEMKEN
ncbi:hypothetical protein DXG03_009345 [Asterophora parasitica]|uniref:Uncharacterized protein n=1 Tax=Asterophora parasitica TaxID=117018 RepID=A0A9P7KCJ2_9AGAR|nr:hypothetical protein DXG03_009345 [Asterophora parasitica]